jgi:hypothetical protein
MAIPSLNVHPCHLGAESGACELISYLGRSDLLDVRLAKRFDHRHLGIDLVHEEVIRGAGVSAVFEDVAYLANCIDETRIVSRPHEHRRSHPQTANRGGVSA